MVQWFTLKYVTSAGAALVLYNLQRAGCESIERAQSHLGSRDFVREPQPYHYSQLEIDLFRGA